MRFTDSLYNSQLDEPVTLHLFADAMLALMQDGIFLPAGAQQMACELAKWDMLTRRNLCQLLAITPTALAGYEGRVAEQRRELLYAGLAEYTRSSADNEHGTQTSDEEIPMFDE